MAFKKNTVLLFIYFCTPLFVFSQHRFSGKIIDKESKKPILSATVFDKTSGKEATTNQYGQFTLNDLKEGVHQLVFYHQDYRWKEIAIDIPTNIDQTISLSKILELNEVVILGKKKALFDLKRIKDVEGTSIYAGKKNEIVMVDQLIGNKSNNNARQVYAQVAGLNIYESTNCGLQLAIGGRGLDPNRTANFNTRQNAYDISADVLGYPESYYTPPVEALESIEIIRGAASLQYGTQFGGLIHFKLKKPSLKPWEINSRHTFDSNCGYATFNSISGTQGKFSHYSYISYKNNLNQAPRPNMDLKAVQLFSQLGYAINQNTNIQFEYTHSSYTAQQAGGLTDAQFYKDPTTSNRSRNWFEVNWNLFALKLQQKFGDHSQLDANIFGLYAKRNAIGFRTNRVSQEDDPNEARDLQKGLFRNWGLETRFLTKYELGSKKATLLLGAKYYQAKNAEQQGPGSKTKEADFSFATYTSDQLPIDLRQSDFEFPNLNFAFFGENIFYLNDKLSITPGFRLEHIHTKSNGTYRAIDRDLANNIIRDQTFSDDRSLKRTRILLGVGLGYKMANTELYANISQNYRSVTFNDIRIINPSFQIDTNINDEKGFTADLGFRGQLGKLVSFDANIYGLLYDDRIGEVLREETRKTASGETITTGKVVRYRGNIGRALIYGLESLIDWNLRNTFWPEKYGIKANFYSNLAITNSEYLKSEIAGVQHKKVEFVPNINLRTGLKLGYKNLLADIQFSHLGKQYTDASNAPQNKKDNQSGIIGSIPAYSVWDLSLSYRFKNWTVETGVNNFLNKAYFTQRATGYPGPGIIPAMPRSVYLTLGLKL
ncbi:MAG: TonB-dependent receptor [Flavobacteriaceae bacterium]|nr:TonB-dependent receptor [Flavobacteriaceae bacterium]